MLSENKTEPKVFAIVGPPGTGKTTTLANKAAEAVEKLGPRAVLIASLTRAAAAEAAARDIPVPNECIGTLHSHAYRALGRPKIAETKLKHFNSEFPAWRISSAHCDPDLPRDPRQNRAVGDKVYEKRSLYRACMVPREKWDQQTLEFDETWNTWADGNNLLDFESLVEKARIDTVAAPGSPRLIYGDEAQDWSRSEFELCLHWGRAAEALILLGDWDQAIYEWRGADPEALRTLKVPSDRRNVLSRSYRVPRSVRQAAVEWIQRVDGRDRVEYQPREEEGEVRRLSARYTNPRPLINDVQRVILSGRSAMILSACSFHLAKTIRALRAEGIPFHNPYRRKNGLWNPLSRVARPLAFLALDRGTWLDAARPWTWGELWKFFGCIDGGKYLRPGTKEFLKDLADNKDHCDSPAANNEEDALALVNGFFKDPSVLSSSPDGLRLLSTRWCNVSSVN